MGVASNSPTSASPYRPSPKLSVTGDPWNSPKPFFPLTVESAGEEEEEKEKEKEEEQQQHTVEPATPEYNLCASSKGRQLSVFEEESEPESVTSLADATGPRGSVSSPYTSPRMSPRSRHLLNSRTSPNFVSKSDPSEDEDEDDDTGITELLTTSNRFPTAKNSSLSRLSPNHSPLLTSRKSPTHWTGSSDEELSGIFESTHKLRKRLQGKKKKTQAGASAARLVRGSSVCSVDAQLARKVSRDKLLKLRHYSSLPCTSDNGSIASRVGSVAGGQESESEAKETSGGYSSDVASNRNEEGALRLSPLSRFEASDDEGDRSGDGGMEVEVEDNVQRTQSAILHCALCTIS